MVRREWNVARNGQFWRLAKSAGVRRNPHEYAGTGAIRQEKTPTENDWGLYWWSRRESNPRPQVLYRQFYILSLVI